MNPGGTILYLGPKWRGSDARALGAALRRLGLVLIEVDIEDYFPLQWSTLPLRLVRRALCRSCTANYNQAVRAHLGNAALDMVLVFKGLLLDPQTLRAFKSRHVPLYCLYPDVSFFDHGANIWECLPLYDCVFTTKTFHLTDERVRRRVQELRLLAHGYDPDVHRPVTLSEATRRQYACDVGFIGCWSPKKEALLRAVCQALDGIRIQIWGPGWNYAQQPVRARWQGRGAYGDEMALICQAARVNLGLLSEAGTESAQGDQTTARTWQIPACGAFMLHERTDELRQYFVEGREIAAFDSPAELVRQIGYYLAHEAERQDMAQRGYQRCVASGYTYDPAARAIMDYHRQRLAAAPPVAQ